MENLRVLEGSEVFFRGLQHHRGRFRSAPGDPSLHHGDHGFIYPVRKL